jgi:hypothetical protein
MDCFCPSKFNALVKSQNWDGKVPAFRLFKIKASAIGAFGDNPVHEAYIVRRNDEG